MHMGKALGLVTLVLLAGCSDSGTADVDDEEKTFEHIDAQATQDTGLIRGIVVDASITPLEGATVSLENAEASTQTNADGAFVFADLEPRTYFLTVSKTGYESVQASADVVAGEDRPPIVKVQLTRLPGSDPFVVPHSYTGYISCAFKAQNIVFDSSWCDPLDTQAFGEDDAVVYIPVERPPDYYQNEIQWKSTQQLGDGLVTIQWACAESGGCNSNQVEHRTCNIRGPSPLVCQVGRDGGGGSDAYLGINGTSLGQDGRGLWIQMFSHCAVCHPDEAPCHGAAGIAIVCPGAGYGVALQQTFDLYTHLFYNFVPDEAWRFIEDGAPPVPDS